MSHWTATDRAYERALRKEDFSPTQRALLRFIQFYSVARGRYYARIPKQEVFALCLGLDASEVSRDLGLLIAAGVIEEQGGIYTLVPPPWPRLARAMERARGRKYESRVMNAGAVSEWEAWLEVSNQELQVDLFAEPSLNDARRETFGNFVGQPRTETEQPRQRDAATERLTEPSAMASQSRTGGPEKVILPSPAAPFGKNPSGWPAGEHPQKVEVGKDPTKLGLSQLHPSAEIRGRDPGTETEIPVPEGSRSRDRVLGLGLKRVTELEYRAYVEQRLFATIGEHERHGKCSVLWEMAVRDIPEKLDELIGEVVGLSKEGRLRSPIGALLNHKTYRAHQAYLFQASKTKTER